MPEWGSGPCPPEYDDGSCRSGVLGHVRPSMTMAHAGVGFTSFDNDNDLLTFSNCAALFGGGWWYTKCYIWCPTMPFPTWFSTVSAFFYPIENARMMMKLQ